MRRGKRRENEFLQELLDIKEYLAHESSTAEAFASYLSLSGRAVSERVSAVLRFLQSERQLDLAGCATLLMETHRELVRSAVETTRERIVESVEERYERYYEVLKKEGYV